MTLLEYPYSTNFIHGTFPRDIYPESFTQEGLGSARPITRNQGVALEEVYIEIGRLNVSFQVRGGVAANRGRMMWRNFVCSSRSWPPGTVRSRTTTTRRHCRDVTTQPRTRRRLGRGAGHSGTSHVLEGCRNLKGSSQICAYDKDHRPIQMQPGDWVYIKLHHGYDLPGKPPRKHSPQRMGQLRWSRNGLGWLRSFYVHHIKRLAPELRLLWQNWPCHTPMKSQFSIDCISVRLAIQFVHVCACWCCSSVLTIVQL